MGGLGSLRHRPSKTQEHLPTSFHGVAEVATTGVDTWTWHEETKSTGSMATVTCTKGSKTHTGSAHFVVR